MSCRLFAFAWVYKGVHTRGSRTRAFRGKNSHQPAPRIAVADRRALYASLDASYILLFEDWFSTTSEQTCKHGIQRRRIPCSTTHSSSHVEARTHENIHAHLAAYVILLALFAHPAHPQQEVYFSEMLSGDDSVVVLEDGPFRFTASCKTVTYDFDIFSSSDSSSSLSSSSPSSSSSSSSSSYSSSLGGSSRFGLSSSPSYYYSQTSGCCSPCDDTTPIVSPCSSSFDSIGEFDSGTSDDDDDLETTSSSINARAPDMFYYSSAGVESSPSTDTTSLQLRSSTTSKSSFTDPFPTTISSGDDYTDFTYTERFVSTLSILL